MKNYNNIHNLILQVRYSVDKTLFLFWNGQTMIKYYREHDKITKKKKEIEH